MSHLYNISIKLPISLDSLNNLGDTQMGKLYEQALLDAREIRATALANAKVALEEAFRPELERMISDKIHRDLVDEKGEEFAAEPEMPAEDPMAEPVVADPMAAAPVADPMAGGEGEEGEVSGASDDFPEIETDPTAAPGGEEEVPDELDLLETGAGTDVTSGAGADPEGQKGKQFKTAGSPFDTKAKAVLEGEQDTLDLESIIRELEEEVDEDEEEKEEHEEKEEEEDEEKVGESTKVTADADKDPEGASGSGTKNAPYTAGSKSITESGEEEIDLDEILRELEAEENPQPITGEVPPEELGGGDGQLEFENQQLQQELQTVKSDLDEHRKVLSLLKSRLTEVNLLNAKLLYTNRLFKGYTLNNSQKMKVVENFDRAKNIREVKLVYATIAESLSQTDLVKKSAKVVSKITEGFASKTQKSTKPVIKQSSIIDDGSAERLKKLAGIIH